MVKIRILGITLLYLFSFTACKRQTYNEQILATSHKFISAIKRRDIEDMKDLIGVKLSIIGKDIEYLRFDINKCNDLFDTYCREEKMKIVITNQVNGLGEMLIKVPIFNGYDSTTKLTKAVLDIYFGPPNIIPLSKISGYEVETQYDNDKNLLSDSIKIYR